MDNISQPLRVLGGSFILSCTIRSWVYIASKFIFPVTIWLHLILLMIPMWYWNELHMKSQNSLPSSGLMPIPLLQQLLALWRIRSFHNTSHTMIAQRNGVYTRRASLLAGWCMFLPMVESASTCALFWLLPKGLSYLRTCKLSTGQSTPHFMKHALPLDFSKMTVSGGCACERLQCYRVVLNYVIYLPLFLCSVSLLGLKLLGKSSDSTSVMIFGTASRHLAGKILLMMRCMTMDCIFWTRGSSNHHSIWQTSHQCPFHDITGRLMLKILLWMSSWTMTMMRNVTVLRVMNLCSMRSIDLPLMISLTLSLRNKAIYYFWMIPEALERHLFTIWSATSCKVKALLSSV